RYLALFHGLRRVASDCDGVPPRRDRQPLAIRGARPVALLRRWLRHWTQVRHRDGAERTLLTAVAGDASPAELAALLLTAVTDRTFADGGHALDFINKAFECLDIIGWQEAPLVLPTVVDQLVSARGGEELNAWRHPLDLVGLCEAASAKLGDLLAAGRSERGSWRSHACLARQLLADDPEAIVAALAAALRLYLIRFLNVPPARLPGEADDRLDDLPDDREALCDAFLQALDRQGSVRNAGRLVARYLTLGHPADNLITTLAHAVLREDA